tara:strand:+ start:4025 stop:4285 length:261 start_codon:yes stop_codon:yes gene_type:complete
METFVEIVQDYGFSVLLSLGMGYFIWYVWKYVSDQLEPIIDKQHVTLIKLIDQIRMLDQDQIRLKQKLETLMELREKEKNEKDISN